MNLKPDTFALTVVLAFLTGLGPLATDMYLPAIGAIQVALDGTVPTAQLTLSLFLLGFAGGQLIYGPISDRFGRRPVLLASLAIVVAADLACALSPEIVSLVVARAAVGIGTAGPIVLARSIVRDLYSGARAGHELSRMGSVMGLAPAIGPVLGAVVLELAGWRMIFGVQLLLAATLAMVVFLALPETIGERRRREPLRAADFPGIYLRIIKNPVFALYGFGGMFVFGGFFAFIASVAIILQKVYGLAPVAIGGSFTLIAIAFVTGTLIGARLVMRIGIDRSLTWGAGLMLAGAILMPLLLLDSTHRALDVIFPSMICTVGLGISLPQSIAGAITPFPERAGAASSVFGFMQMTFGALISTVLGLTFDGSAMPLAVMVLCLALAALAMNIWTRRALGPKAQPRTGS